MLYISEQLLIPFIIKCIKQNNEHFTTYLPSIIKNLQKRLPNGPLFLTLREAFNNGSCLPAVPCALMKEIFEQNFMTDITGILKQYYLQLLTPNLTASPEAALWTPV